MGGSTQIGTEGLRLDMESWSELAKPFGALPDRVNEWTIILPKELIAAVRRSSSARRYSPRSSDNPRPTERDTRSGRLCQDIHDGMDDLERVDYDCWSQHAMEWSLPATSGTELAERAR